MMLWKLSPVRDDREKYYVHEQSHYSAPVKTIRPHEVNLEDQEAAVNSVFNNSKTSPLKVAQWWELKTMILFDVFIWSGKSFLVSNQGITFWARN